MSGSATATTLRDEVLVVVLGLLPKLRLPAREIIEALDAGKDPRIPSRKAMNIIARVHKHFGLNEVLVKKSDLTPEQVTSIRNLVDLLTRRLAPPLGR